jgi:hypothetical protein
VLLNTVAFAVSLLVVVILLLLPNHLSSPELTLGMVSLAFVVAFNFSLAVAQDLSITYLVLAVMAMYALGVVTIGSLISKDTQRRQSLLRRSTCKVRSDLLYLYKDDPLIIN